VPEIRLHSVISWSRILLAFAAREENIFLLKNTHLSFQRIDPRSSYTWFIQLWSVRFLLFSTSVILEAIVRSFIDGFNHFIEHELSQCFAKSRGSVIEFLNVWDYLVALGPYLALQKISYLEKFERRLWLVRWCAYDIRRSGLLFWSIRAHIRSSSKTWVYLTKDGMQWRFSKGLNRLPFLTSKIFVLICTVLPRSRPDYSCRLMDRHVSIFLTWIRRWIANRASRAFERTLDLVVTGTWIFIWLIPNPGSNAECSMGKSFLFYETWLWIWIWVTNHFACWVELPPKAPILRECPLCFTSWGVGWWLANHTVFSF